jgi:hypothetical protein
MNIPQNLLNSDDDKDSLSGLKTNPLSAANRNPLQRPPRPVTTASKNENQMLLSVRIILTFNHITNINSFFIF